MRFCVGAQNFLLDELSFELVPAAMSGKEGETVEHKGRGRTGNVC